MNTLQKKHTIFARRKIRIRAKIFGTAERPRLAIFKSHKYIYAQIIDDVKGHTIVAFDSRMSKAKTPVERAKEVGVEIAKIAKVAKVAKVVFDRGGYIYTGKIKMVADAAREGGLEF
ncbi:MAG: 50S ribosomal protein L18 [Candidatus Taylorbacteria bacterium RIFCSPHIGHO2_02_FULL_45_28]|uniref:Large ribosomal subunit protein uL18 n=1 Tax=Candidatus Taylorbacteria bacterium RIFCSPHIGHO2_12_FULL_45_16 TaxID=1802315 RepID=A0A1G2N1P0_9BACT|nr:MAG: 50S ribosomal protein L18 [Candidatus Taylorbacteria bacterium RIFCSPHIGHO2_01_FULL_44_110]OHA25453.1 MAG: 50S ribosomal protein L18 [Candidatus Taylorbacteria bacterium RIFCSPHIGHO2_02_FULL_45_28]OHA29121.1 MAG: 50S ribosomal protein L18 [Candidatus Taylorbacteria bacterium RIFCSPHIGHO2_12_FULL_45_16]OHA33343.1 MAG: 50S ribosomal protein L18 [Candidatus Taylorbacteria bacterium RIFCSPLOWO2_01_FULL_45_59]OHA38745.1 MAG: 50S ribosomal protein L18 [Candidatus Taylorbacteria bacterium RIFC